jgi:CPA1 family monovalent cation:H+ antiporter
MEVQLVSMLSLFTLLSISSATYFLSKRIKVPYTVLLVAIGVLLVPLSRIPLFSFIKEFPLTPSMLFYIFLPILIFESAYNINTRRMMESIRSITLLSVVGLLISTFFVGFALYGIFGFFHFEIPLMVALLFGALISATDPVAVLALFKEYGAPRRLSLIFEGESLFNDGTAVAVFLIMLEIAESGFHGLASIGEGVFLFTTMVVGGIIFGGLMGVIFSKAIEWTRTNESVSILLMFVLSHLTFLLTEVLSEHLSVMGHEIKLSAIISTLIAAMVVGNYGRSKISPRAEEFIEKFWGQAAFMANSIVFLLIGLLFATIRIDLTQFIWPIIGAVLIVATARALSVYPVIFLLNRLGTEKNIPRSWQHLLAWGSLRGALAVMVVLIIPDTLQFPGWMHAYSPKEFLMGLTIGCIYATLFIKATTISRFMSKLKVNSLTDIEKEAKEDSLSLIHTRVLEKLESMKERGFIDTITYEKLFAFHEEAYKRSTEAKTVLEEHPGHEQITHQVLEIHAIGTEKHVLKTLFAYGEITEPVYKKILNKLTIQLEKAESGSDNIDRAEETDKKNIVDFLMDHVNALFPKPKKVQIIGEQYMYYRAQSIIARKALIELENLIKGHGEIFNKRISAEVLAMYEEFRLSSEKKMNTIAERNKTIIRDLNEKLAQRGIFKAQEEELDLLKEREMITPKIYIELKGQFEHEGGI